MSAPPPAYTRSILCPLRPDDSTSKTLILAPLSMISAIQEHNNKVMFALRSDVCYDEVYIPKDLGFDAFVAAYAPGFAILTDRVHGKRIAVNPNRILQLYKDGDTHAELIVQRIQSSRVNVAKAMMVKAFNVEESLLEACRKIDATGTEVMLQDIK